MANYATSQELLDTVMRVHGYSRHDAYVFSFALLAAYATEDYMQSVIEFISELEVK